jgi:vitamin B12/bleomycin/antimicrobial peptide transport system ATP-binding/permease protein
VPTGTLRRAANYPEAAESRTREEIEAAFRHVGLNHLFDRLDEEAPWDHTLSGGEKQRLAFARVFLANPDIIDEATAPSPAWTCRLERGGYLIESGW